MPNCFALIPKSNPEDGPESLNTIDEKMCKHFKVSCDDKLYLNGWYDSVGFRLALGMVWDEIRKDLKEYSSLVMITDWLEANYIAEIWVER